MAERTRFRDDTRPDFYGYVICAHKETGELAVGGVAADRAGLASILAYRRTPNNPYRPLYVVWHRVETPPNELALRADLIEDDAPGSPMIVFGFPRSR